MTVPSFKAVRITVLFAVLAGVILYTAKQRFTTGRWYKPRRVVIYPVNLDGAPETTAYIQALPRGHFSTLDRFTARESKKFEDVSYPPTETRLGPVVRSRPPQPPGPQTGMLGVALWSLQLRWWAYRNTPDDQSNVDRVRIFVVYQQGKVDEPLDHSTGLRNGLLGVVHAFARDTEDAQNNVVIAHELLHTFGATDKYDPNGEPRFPDGYADPDRVPRHPQARAEIMAGLIPLSPISLRMPKSLDYVVVGDKTAQEIGWSRVRDPSR